MLLQKLRNYITTKRERNTTVVFTPSFRVFVWVRPEQVAYYTGIGNIYGSSDASNLIHGVQLRRKTAVNTEHLFVNDSCDGKAVEAVSEGLPQLYAVSSLTFIIEAIDTVDGSALVVATEQEEILGILDFVGKEKANGLKTLFATIDVISQEEIVGIRREATVFKQTKKIIVLAVDITNDLDWRLELEENGLLSEDLVRGNAEALDLGLGQVN